MVGWYLYVRRADTTLGASFRLHYRSLRSGAHCQPSSVQLQGGAKSEQELGLQAKAPVRWPASSVGADHDGSSWQKD